MSVGRTFIINLKKTMMELGYIRAMPIVSLSMYAIFTTVLKVPIGGSKDPHKTTWKIQGMANS